MGRRLRGGGRAAPRAVERVLRIGACMVAATSLVAVAAVGSAGGHGAVRDLRHTATLTAATSEPTAATRDGDNQRTGWYPDETNLSPALVAGGTFGQLFNTSVNGAVYGQPLVDDGQLLVDTENNYAYGLDPVSGAILWTRQFGSAPQASDIGCADLAPSMGITGTPVVDQATNTEYLVDDQYVSGTSGPQADYMHALNLAANGAEEPGFPVQIAGTAQNNSSFTFNPTYELQRPGLLLMNGVVYAAFGAHCDETPWTGWIAGVSEAGKLTTMWSADSVSGANGAGIWMSGGGLVSDGSGQILFATGNGGTNTTPTPGKTPTANLAESVARVAVQSDGTLKATDFFEPYDALALDQSDLDFGSGSPVALPNSYFGTAATPHLAVEVGKEGYVYLLNRDNLGGFAQGADGTDSVLGRYGPNGGVWSSPAVWPGDGGWVYIPTASGSISAGGSEGLLDAYQYGLDGSGKPSLNLVGSSSDAFGFGTSAPVITSNGATSGSALLWTVWSPDGTGVGAQLRAYNPVPVNGTMQLVWSAPVGTASKFNPPGVAGNRMYVGTRTGAVEGFGAPVTSPVTAPAPTFPATVLGQSSTQTVTLTASTTATVTAIKSTGPFTVGTPSKALPATLTTGSTMTVPITFTPTVAGAAGGSLTITTSGQGTTVDSLTGEGQVAGPSLTSSTLGVSFGGIPPGQQSSQSVAFANNGSQQLTISSVTAPGVPFSVTGAPAAGTILLPGQQVVVNVDFAPTVNGTYNDNLVVASNGGTVDVIVTGSSNSPALLQITPMSTNFGSTPVGSSVTKTFTVTNTGGSNLTIAKSKPPVLGPFTATTTLPEGTTMQPGQSFTESITFTPSAVGATTDGWVITGSDGQGVRTVQFTGSGTLGDPGATGWTRNGSATLSGGSLQLTAASKSVTGSSFAPVAVAAQGLDIHYTSTITGSATSGDGNALVLADPSVAATSIGRGALDFGVGGLPGLAVVLSTVRVPGGAPKNFVGVSDGTQPKSPKRLHFLATSTALPNLHAAVAMRVTYGSGVLSVFVNGTDVLTVTVTAPPNVRVGFTGSTGATGAAQVISGVTISAGGPDSIVGDPTAGGWTLNGSSKLSGGVLQLTQAGSTNQAGTAFWPTPLSGSDLSVTFTSTIGGGGATGADGLTLVLADDSTAPTAVGTTGGGLGFSGIKGVAVALDTYANSANPSNNFVGVTNGPVTPTVPGNLNWLATDTSVASLRASHLFKVNLSNGTLSVTMDGIVLLSTPVTVGHDVLLGFSGGNGGLTDTHSVSGVTATAAPDVPVAVGDPIAGGWDLNGSTSQSGGMTQLTQPSPDQAGTAFWPTPVTTDDLSVTYTTTIGGGGSAGADGLALVLADPTTSPTAVGYTGGGLGFSGLSALAVCVDTYLDPGYPSGNFVGISNGPVTSSVPDVLNWLSTANVVPSLRATHTFTVKLDDGTLTVTMDGNLLLTQAVNVGPKVLVGFSGGTGLLTDTHAVSGTSILAT